MRAVRPDPLLPRLALRAALALGLAAAALPARAWGSLLLIDPPPATTTLALGASVWSLPQHPGARTSQTTLLPAVDLEAANGVFASTDTGLGWNLSKRASVQAGVRLWPQFGRRARDVPPGIGAVGDRLQIEAFANVVATPALLLQSGLSWGAAHDRDGAILEIGATSGVPIGADLLGIGVAASYANSAWRQSYYGVSAQQAAASGLPETRLGAGWQDLGLTLSTEHRFGPHWRVDLQWIGARLLGAAAASPLTQARWQRSFTLDLWRTF